MFVEPRVACVPYPVCRRLDGRWSSFDMIDNHLLTGRFGEVVEGEAPHAPLVVVRFVETGSAPEVVVACDQADLRPLNIVEKIGDLDG